MWYPTIEPRETKSQKIFRTRKSEILKEVTLVPYKNMYRRYSPMK